MVNFSKGKDTKPTGLRHIAMTAGFAQIGKSLFWRKCVRMGFFIHYQEVAQ